MLSERDNETLTRVGPGTAMGDLLRRYWHPIGASSELMVVEPNTTSTHRGGTKAVQLLGEELVLFKDLKGRLGLVEKSCAHRRVNLVYGIPEEEGIRCPYHGWMYDTNGRCVEQPYEKLAHPGSRFKDTIRLTSYPVEELGGLIFAYLGPEPAPLLPRWDILVRQNVIRDIEYVEIPCNWLQIQENSADTLHNLWLHEYYTKWILGTERPTRNAQNLDFEVTDYGLIKRRLHEGATEWETEPPMIFPNALRLRNQMQIRVPMNDDHTLHVLYSVYPAPPGVTAPAQEQIPWRGMPMFDERGRRLLDFNQGQDTMAWVTQGAIARRDKENLSSSDRGIVMFRRMLQEQLEVVRDGGDPMNVFKDPARNATLELVDTGPAGPGGMTRRRGSEQARELVRRMYETAT